MYYLQVPFLDLKQQYNSLKNEIIPEIESVLENSQFILGPKVIAFEENFAKYCNVKHAIALNNGTEALALALMALGIKTGDEVIIPANTFVATAEAIVQCGAVPVLVDIDPESYNINTKLIESKITSKTKAIMPVHLYGQMADMDEILSIAKKHNLYVIEDACQAHGAEYKGKKAGSLGIIGCFSFYPGKNLGAYGEGGACVTNSDELARKIKLLREHGSEKKYYHDIVGYNYRMHGLQGAVLNVKLKYLDNWNNSRIKNAGIYTKNLEGLKGLIIPKAGANNKHVFHLYVVQLAQAGIDREEFIDKLKKQDITALIHYPLPIHLQKGYQFLGYKEGDFPVTESAARRIVSLPMYPELSEEQILHVCNSIKHILADTKTQIDGADQSYDYEDAE